MTGNDEDPRVVGGWDISELVGAGKSAKVYRGTKSGQEAAVKVFNQELVDRFGRESQMARVERELDLKGHGHPNLVDIVDGGECKSTSLLYVVMKLLPWRNLDEVRGEVPITAIRGLIAQIAQAAKYLEDRNLAHRDIKPSNIAVSNDFSQAILLDLGVLRPVGQSDITDESYRPFVGTLQYSPPEFLLREEEDTTEGWRAVTFYQLGGVLHDLLTGRRLFQKYSDPFARLVLAVHKANPVLPKGGEVPDLVCLAENCLLKKPENRLMLVGWDDFEDGTHTRLHDVRRRVENQLQRIRLGADSGGESDRSDTAKKLASLAAKRVGTLIRNEIISSPVLPPVEIRVEEDILCVRTPVSGHEGVELAMKLCADCVEASDRLISVGAQAGMIKLGEDYVPSVTAVSVFVGKYTSEGLSAAIKEFVWATVEEAYGIVGAPNPPDLPLDLDLGFLEGASEQ